MTMPAPKKIHRLNSSRSSFASVTSWLIMTGSSFSLSSGFVPEELPPLLASKVALFSSSVSIYSYYLFSCLFSSVVGVTGSSATGSTITSSILLLSSLGSYSVSFSGSASSPPSLIIVLSSTGYVQAKLYMYWSIGGDWGMIYVREAQERQVSSAKPYENGVDLLQGLHERPSRVKSVSNLSLKSQD